MESPERFAAHELRPRSGRGASLEILALGLAWALLYLPGFAEREFVNEEARRALPARAMVESGDWIVPHIWGREYLAKPPGMFWLVAASSHVSPVRSPASSHAIDQAATRLPALLATLGTALLLHHVLRNRRERRLGLLAALLFLFAPLSFEKGALGEIETPFGFFVFAGSWAIWTSRKVKGHVWPAGVLFGLAALTKGPPAWVFLGALVGALGCQREISWRLALDRGLRVLLLSAAVCGVWILLLMRAVPWDTLRASWTDEVVGVGLTWTKYLADRQSFLTGVLAGFLPASGFLVAALLSKKARRHFLQDELFRLACITLLIGIAFFLVFPRSRPRYVFPLLPWCAAAGGLVLSGALSRAPRPLGLACARWSARVLGAVGILAGALITLQILGVEWLDIELADAGPGLPIATFLVGCNALWLARRKAFEQRVVPALLAAAGVLISARLFQLTEIAPAYAGRYERVAMAAELDRAVPEGETVYTGFWSEFNLLAHSQRRFRFVPPAELALHSDAYCVHPCPREQPQTCDSPVCPHARGQGQWEELRRLNCPKRSYVLSVDRRLRDDRKPSGQRRGPERGSAR